MVLVVFANPVQSAAAFLSVKLFLDSSSPRSIAFLPLSECTCVSMQESETSKNIEEAQSSLDTKVI